MNDARMVLIVKLTCVTDIPSSDGTINCPIRLTPACPGSNRNPNSSPRILRLGNCIANCAAPPATTPTATPMIGSSRRGERNNAQPMMKIFRNNAAYAGTAKARIEFNMPIATEARLMNNR